MNILIGPKLGDFFHCLLVPKIFWELDKQKSNIFLCEKHDIFTNSLIKTYDELKPVVLKQEYVKNFKIHTNELIDLDISNFRKSNLLGKESWTKILKQMFFEFKKEIFNIKIIDWKKDSFYKDFVILNRSMIRQTTRGNSIFKKIIDSKKCLFIYSYHEYGQFLYKDSIKSLKCSSIDQMLTVINSCKMFFGNLSSPLAMAHCLNVNRLCELAYPDAPQYMKEISNYDRISWFTEDSGYMSNLHKDFLKEIQEV